MTAAWLDWLALHAAWALAFSVLGLLAALALLPLVLSRLPVDYFCARQRRAVPQRHPVLALALALLRNLIGGLLVLVGLITLFTPGQGLVTLLAGLMIANYPGKYALERWLIKRPRALSGVNWMRARSGQPPLLHPDECGDDETDPAQPAAGNGAPHDPYSH